MGCGGETVEWHLWRFVRWFWGPSRFGERIRGGGFRCRLDWEWSGIGGAFSACGGGCLSLCERLGFYRRYNILNGDELNLICQSLLDLFDFFFLIKLFGTSIDRYC